MDVSSELLQQFSDFVATRIGLHFPPKRWPDLLHCIEALAREFEYPDPESCARSLMDAPLTRRQIETLASHLSVGETYFFREPAVFAALEQELLPRLIEIRRSTGKRLRIWSTGCCTGEEPYSLAILISRLIPDLADWNITILGSDINSQFLQKAARGVYRDWSFRGVPAWIKPRYFTTAEPDSYAILPQIKRLVSFDHLNLAHDIYPALENNTNAMDIILCRNVLMYFDQARARQVIQKLHRSLVDGGWLIVGPAETGQGSYPQFEVVSFPDAILYRKSAHLETTPPVFQWVKRKPPPEPEPRRETVAVVEDQSETVGTLYQEALQHYEHGAYAQAVAVLEAAGNHGPHALALLARAYANQGRLGEAGFWCDAAIAGDKCNAGLRYLQAMVCEEQDRVHDALTSLKQALYLDQNFVLAHFALGSLYQRLGKRERAARHFATTVTLLNGYSPDGSLPESEGMTAGRLMEIIRAREGIT